MSYILEALQKSDRERQRGSVPDLSSEHDTVLVHVEEKNPWPIVFLITIVACTALISYVFWPSHNISADGGASPSVSQQLPSSVSQSNPAQALNSSTQTGFNSVPKSQAMPSRVSNFADNAQPVATDFSQQSQPGRRVVLSKPKAVAPKRSTETVVPVQPEIRRETVASQGTTSERELNEYEALLEEEEEEEAFSNQRASDLALLERARRQTQARPEPTKSANRDFSNSGNYHLSFPDINELDSSVANLLPDLEFTTHIYSTDSEKSFVMVNGQLLVEGENINSSLAVVKILPQHVVLDFEGSQFRVESLKTWRK